MTEEPLLAPGQELGGRYRVLQPVAEGAIGVVFEALHTWTGRRVALKILRPHLAARGGMPERFVREARTAARIEHPNVVQVLDMGQDEATSYLFLVQEFLQGEDLRTALDRGGHLDVRGAVRLVAPLLDALVAAHSAGVVHRDLKPENVFLARSPSGVVTPRLVDFGMARDVSPGAARLTIDGATVGTPAYMSPEQARGEADVDERVDVWGAGVLLFELLSGRAPFGTDDALRVLSRIQREVAPRLDLLVPGVPAALAALVATALQRDRTKRFQSARAMLAALLDCEAYRSEPWIQSLRDAHRIAARGSNRPVSMPPPAPAQRKRARPRVQGAFGFVPTTPMLLDERVVARFSEALGKDVELVRCADYASLVKQARGASFHLAWMPPVAFVRAQREGLARPLRGLSRAGRADYVSALITRRDLPYESVVQLPGTRAAWVDPWSAAGYLMPRRILRSAGLDPDRMLASQQFAGSYSNVIEALHLGQAEVGASFCTVDSRGELLRVPWSAADQVRVLALSTPIPGDALCGVGPDTAVQGELLARLEELTESPEGQQLLWDFFGAEGIAAPDVLGYQALRAALEEDER